MTEEAYLLQIDQINDTYKKQVENLAVQYIKEKGMRCQDEVFLLEDTQWKVKHSRVKIRPFDVPTVIYQCVMLDSVGKETSVQREFLAEDIEDE